MRNGMKTLLLMLLLLHYTSSSAVQIESFRDHHTLKFIISAQELTHILVKGDRILTVRGNDGTYAVNLNDSDGTVFIKPTTAYQAQPFSVFISTAQGRTIPLFLTPLQLPSDTLIIQPAREEIPRQTAVTEKAESYTTMLLTLIQAMAQRKEYEGFTVSSEKAVTLLKNPTVRIDRVAHYTGTPLHGEVLHISNRSTHVLTFPFEPWIVRNTKALAAESLTLLPGHSLRVYRVQRYEK
jgi:type-F conjugative transfer system secretin TraK